MSPRPLFDLADPQWLGHRYVESEDAFRFIYLERSEHSGVPFLTDDYLGARPSVPDVAAAQVLEQCTDGPLHFLFHSAFCGSTLLTRALDIHGTSMGLSEPMLLNDVAGFRKRGAAGPQVARMAHGALKLLGRPFAPGEAVVVKPSNVANGLIELFMALQPKARAVFLYAPLETFLISVVRKGLPCRLWVRELAENYLREGLFEPLGLDAEALFRQSDLQIAASGWLAQHRLVASLSSKLGDRLRTMDADKMSPDPRGALAAMAAHYGLSIDAEAIATRPLFSKHSKSGAAFTPDDRAREYGEARAAHGEEIATVLSWSGQLAEAAGVEFAGLAPLL